MTARIEAELGWKAVYYFRAVPESWDESVIREIHALGHEIGYHYECMTTCNGNVDAAWHDFLNNLQRLRAIAPVSKICMHGSPRSKWDSRDMWKKYDYKVSVCDKIPNHYLSAALDAVRHKLAAGIRNAEYQEHA